jgi:C-terminal processing protease CtpA/Prc
MSSTADPASPDRFDWNTAPTLAAFMADAAALTQDERIAIISAAVDLLGSYYVHLPFKRDTHGADPLGDLGRLRAALPDPADDVAFHAAVCAIFADLRDLHTQYTLPRPYQTAAAILPFKLGAFVDHGKTRTIVTEILASPAALPLPRGFGIGAEILTWCGVPIETAITALANHSGGASPAARRDRALAAMTLRPMERQPPPDAAVVNLTYRTADGRSEGAVSLPWRVIDLSMETTDPGLAGLVCIDHEGELRRRASARAYHPEVVAAERRAVAHGGRHKPYPDSPALETTLPSVFKAHPLAGTGYGYIRIFTFNPPIPGATIGTLLQRFGCEFVRLIHALPQQGLVIDVRGNGGGCLPLAESLLQTLTSRPIVPQPLEVRATPEMLALCRASGDLTPFVPSLEQPLSAHPGYSLGLPLTPPEWCNTVGQQYAGPVVLIVDARCYSATDAFAAGFQDHGIGTVIGAAPSTGAGGANVWTLPEIQAALGAGPQQSLPRGASLRVALRRTRRVGPNAGSLVEEFGVAPDILHVTTRADLLEGDRDLLALAMRALRP